MLKAALIILPVVLLLAPCEAATADQAKAVVGEFTRAIQNQQHRAVFPGVLAEDFKGYVGGWGATTCVWYDKATFTDHVSAWQSTWSTNITLFNVRETIVTQRSDSTWNVLLNLQIAYLAKPEFGGPTVNAYDVLQVFTINSQATQVVHFVELSALVQSTNSTQMLASTTGLMNALNTKNLTAAGMSYNAKATVDFSGAVTYDLNDWMKVLSQDFATRQNDVAFFSQKQYAACDQYVWYLWTFIGQYDLSDPSANSVVSIMGYSTLDTSGRIMTQSMWNLEGIPVTH